jgi:hypothetical protein
MDDAILRSDLVVLEAVDEQVTLIEEKIAVLAAARSYEKRFQDTVSGQHPS